MDIEDVRHLVARWIQAAQRMEKDMKEPGLPVMGQAGLMHQATAMRGCAEELLTWAEAVED